MEIPVSIDPAKPERFEVDWDAVPSMSERVAANDPTLTDPSGAQQKVSQALASAGVSGPASGVTQHGMAQSAGGSTSEPAQNRLAEAIESAAEQPAPPGKQRAVVVIATFTESGISAGGNTTYGDINQ